MAESKEARVPLGITLAKGLGPLEAEILGVIWEMGQATSRDVFEKMREKKRLGQSTVLTVLRRLTNRGILNRDAGGEVYVYSPTVGREELGGTMIDNLVDVIFQGDVDSVIAYLSARRPEAGAERRN